LDESLEVLKVRSICLDSFFFAASQKCGEQPGGGGRWVRGYGRRHRNRSIKLIVGFLGAIAGCFDHDW
jgi:hypothetical protein